jgi:hypothetical protein
MLSIIDEYSITKLVLSEQCSATQHPFFRLEDRLDITVIHERLKAELENEGITGCTFTPVENFQVGINPKKG